MSDKKRILLVGSSNMNLILNMARLPDKGEFLRDDGGVSYSPGGRSGNVAVAMSRFGIDAELVTRLGQDLYGQKLYTYYKESGVNTSYIKADKDSATGFTVMMKEADGGARGLNFPGANDNLTIDDAMAAIKKNPDGVFVSFDAPFNNVQRLSKLAASYGIPVFIDAYPADANQALESLPCAELFMLDEKDAKRYTGINPSSSQDQLRVAFSLWRKVSAKYIIIDYGARGAMIYDGKRCEVVSPFSYDKPTDITCAREAFSAALTAEYLRSRDVKQSLKYALAAYALTASRYGSTSSVPTDSEIREMLKGK